ncbi:unnamed protein product [Cochlearia groenlandica]
MLDPCSKSDNTRLSFPSIHTNDYSDSGVSSPTLWTTTTPARSPRRRQGDYRSLSPESKAQAIARGQKELMDMVSKMPESCYELSLKDLVEVKGNKDNDYKVFDEMPKRAIKPKKKTKNEKWVDYSRNSGVNNGGFLLKMMFPVSLGSKKDTSKKKTKKKMDFPHSKVSPRPSISEETVKATEDKEWWNILSDSTGSRSTKRSGSSGSNSSNKNRSSSSGCLSFLWSLHSRD